MANESFAIDFVPARAVERHFVASAAFVVLLLLAFVGMHPFDPPALVAQFGGVQETSAGDTLRQFLYVSVFLLILLCALQRRGFGAATAIPFTIALLLGWCLLSAAWAAEPGVALRRAGLEVIVVLSVLLSIDTIGAERAFRIWRIVLAVILVVNWVSIPLIANARHLPGELDTALVGNWRGLYGHKNITGAVCVLTALLFLFSRTGRHNWLGILIAIAATAFLVMTRSKTSLGFLPLAAFVGLIYRLGWRDSLSRAILSTIGLLLLVGAVVFVVLDADTIARTLEDPKEFTGRSAIWVAELRYIRDHPFLGTGFGTFADTGGISPLHAYINDPWVEGVSHGHNGYLQMLVTIGGVGFTLAMLSLVILPLGRLWRLDWGDDSFKPLLVALFLFAVLHNIMESDFLEGDGVNWVSLLLVLGALKQLARPGTLLNR